jgi:hypothetical protein
VVLISINLRKSKQDERPVQGQNGTLVADQLRAADADSYRVKAVLAPVGVAAGGSPGNPPGR